MLKIYLNTKYFLQMYLNTKYIDVFKYFLNTFVNTFLYYFQNIVLIHSIHYKFENERNITLPAGNRFHLKFVTNNYKINCLNVFCTNV